MVKLFLDANCFIDLLETRDTSLAKKIEHHQLTISALTVHIWLYVAKKKLPQPQIKEALAYFQIVDYSVETVSDSLAGPTNDYEDNVQISAALAANCDLFITNDKKLLTLGKIKQLAFRYPSSL